MSSAGPARAFLSIGEVLARLRPEFSDVTISKIRFLESEGLIHPERTSSGYRKFSAADLSRLRYVLAQQRDHYLPLRVIRERLDALDHGHHDDATRPPRALWPAESLPDPHAVGQPPTTPLTRDRLLTETGLTTAELAQLEQYGLVRSRGGRYDAETATVARIAAELARFGIEPRHLRPFRTAADREITLFHQVVAPLLAQKNPEAKARAAEAVQELTALSLRLHATLVQVGLRDEQGL